MGAALDVALGNRQVEVKVGSGLGERFPTHEQTKHYPPLHYVLCPTPYVIIGTEGLTSSVMRCFGPGNRAFPWTGFSGM